MGRITFVLRGPAYLRFVDGIAQCLVEHGHDVTLVSSETAGNETSGNLRYRPVFPDPRLIAKAIKLARTFRSYAHAVAGDHQWPDLLREDLVRWCLPRHVQTLIGWIGRSRIENILRLRVVHATLAGAERLATPHDAILRELRELNPDIVIATPLIYPNSTAEVDYLKGAQMLGRLTGVLVASWDHLTSRGVFHVVPDVAIVWSKAQIEEAVRIHNLPREKVVAVGAPVFDDWFSPRYKLPREVVCQRAGLDPRRPYIVYAASSFIVGDESAIVNRLASELVARAGDLRTQVLVRPHPTNKRGLDGLNRSKVRVWPSVGLFARSIEEKQDYFNTLYHAAAVVGLNTSVFLEAMILDKPCVSIASQVSARAPFAHYEHLLNADCCEFVPEENAAVAIINLLRGRDTRREARREFVKAFIRPCGLDQTAAQAAAEVIEALCLKKIRLAA